MAGAASCRILPQARHSEFNPWKPPNAPTRKPPADQIKKKISSSSSGGGGGKRQAIGLSPPGLGNFRPPNLGFGARAPVTNIGDEERVAMVERVRSREGTWHERAGIIWELQQLGFTAEKLYDAALITPHSQTAMVVAAKVYESLVSAQAAEELLRALESESQIPSLYALRILSARQRKEAAEFLVARNLDAKGAEELARAIKQHERRSEIREGFSPVPGDCLALLHYRAATESSVVEEKRALAEQALDFAVSEVAIEKITRLLESLPSSS